MVERTRGAASMALMPIVSSLAIMMCMLVGLPSASGAVPPTCGCCIPDSPNLCFDASVVDWESCEAFVTACKDALLVNKATSQVIQQNIDGYGSRVTCAGVVACEVGCCCQTAVTPPTGMSMTRRSCQILNSTDPVNDPRDFKATQPGKSCDETCGGTSTGPVYRVSGQVRNNSLGVQNAVVFLGAQQATTDDQGGFSFTNVPAGTQALSVRPIGPCSATPKVLTINSDISEVIDLNCMSACDNQAEIIDFSLNSNGSVTFETRIGGCVVSRMVRRCRQGSTQSCQPMVPVSGNSYMDPSPPEESDLCYVLNVTFTSEQRSVQECTRTGTAVCIQNPGRQWCVGNVQHVCDTSGHLTRTPCGTQACVVSGGIARCVAPADCEQCNSLLGYFAVIDPFITYSGYSARCSNQAAFPPTARCYKDEENSGQPSLISAYSACMGVKGCGQYASPATCTQNPCNVTKADGTTDTCKWVTVSAELGIGLCTSVSRPNCELCDQIPGGCTQSACTAISQATGQSCYYDAAWNGLDPALFGGLPRCVAKADMACRYYDTRIDCLGGRAALVSAQWNPGATARTGGTHVRNPTSHDVLGLGVCSAWVGSDSDGYCIKNADQSPGATKDDCEENQRFDDDPDCVKDATPPVTNLPLSAKIENTLINALPFQVDDENATTRVCVAARGSSCYPNQEAGAVTVPAPGNHTIFYYSEDQNKNLEQVKSRSVEITASPFATLTQVTVTEYSP